MDPQAIAASIVGEIHWDNPAQGWCQCPGHALHTARNGEKDCRISIDGAPTLFCFHSHCAPVIAEYNHRLRAALGESGWELILPGGKILKSGESLSPTGDPVPRIIPPENDQEKLLLTELKSKAENFRDELFAKYEWPLAQIVAESPRQVAGRDDPDEHFQLWLRLWPCHETIWIGNVYSSGDSRYQSNFNTIPEWSKIGPVLGNFTCGSAFRPGSTARTIANMCGKRFLVVESDTLTKDQSGAIFQFMRQAFHYPLVCIIDTAGKSLHGWFEFPPSPIFEAHLKVLLIALGCDGKMFTASQPVRVPGAMRDGKMQKLIWIKE